MFRRPIESTHQYASRAYRDALAREGMRHSMSRTRDCWDNAVAESFFATLEHEMLADADFHSHREATLAITAFIQPWYNQERLHSTLGHKSPRHFTHELRQLARAA